jgi:uncharacterized MAPEG superfamily protein
VTTPMWSLLVVAVLPYVLSTLTGVYRKRELGAIDNKNPRAQQAALTGVGARAVAAQQNAWEALAFFAPAVLVSQLAGADPGWAATLSVGFVATRVVHPIFYLADLDALRSLAFLVGLVCGIGLFAISI